MSTTNLARGRVLADIDQERERQDAKWGEQNHPDGTGPDSKPLQPLMRVDLPYLDRDRLPGLTAADRLARLFTEVTNDLAAEGLVAWRDILLEEVFEALAEADPTRLRTELIQIAAVSAQWAEAIDRRAAAGAE